MLVVFMVLWRLRLTGRPMGWLFGAYLAFAGVERFLVEILRAKDDRLLGPFTLAQLTSVLVAATGLVVMSRLRGAGDPAPGDYLTKKAA
jgi:phosphatidylglycerol:prolipoprotein diacylglycerol transferase